MLAVLQLTVPVAPTAGVAQVNAGPEVCVNDTNVVLQRGAGRGMPRS
jgi:hypothetical protein